MGDALSSAGRYNLRQQLKCTQLVQEKIPQIYAVNRYRPITANECPIDFSGLLRVKMASRSTIKLAAVGFGIMQRLYLQLRLS